MKSRKAQTVWVSKEYILVVLAVVGLFILVTFGVRVCTSIEKETMKGSTESFLDVYEGITILTSTKNLTRCGVEVAFQDNEALTGFSAAQARVSPDVGLLRSLTTWISDARINRPEADYCASGLSCIVLCDIEGTPNPGDCSGAHRLEARELYNVTKIKRKEDGFVKDLVYYGDETGRVDYLQLEKIGERAPYTVHISEAGAEVQPCQTAVKIKRKKFGEKPKFEKPSAEQLELS